MSLYTFFGCLFLAYSPILSIFFFYIASNAQYVLLMVSSAFFCLIALLLSSVIWYLAKDVQNIHYISITYSIAIQEICRYVFFLLLSRVESGLITISNNPQSPFNRSTFAFVSGFGYSLMCSLVSYISLLVESIGPGVIMCVSCPRVSVYFMSAITTSLFSLLHILWMVIAFEGYMDKARLTGWLKISWVVLSHYGASYGTTLISSTVNYGCVYATVISLVVFVVSLFIITRSLKSRYQIYKRK